MEDTIMTPMEGTLASMEKALRDECIRLNLKYVTIADGSIEKIYNLWINEIFVEPDNEIEYLYFGSYYVHKSPIIDHELVKKYYTRAIEEGNVPAIYDLGKYYGTIEKNNELMKKYLLLAIEKHGDTIAMNNLALYYKEVEQNVILSKKYYHMAIEGGNKMSCRNLGICYFKKKPMKALYYCSMGASFNDVFVLIKNISEQNISPDKYFYQSIPHLEPIKDKLPLFMRLFIKLYLKEVDILKDSFNFAPGQDGYAVALEDFQSRISS